MNCPNAGNSTIVGFLRPSISYRTENCLSYVLVVVQVWFIPEQWFHTVSYRNIRFRCVLGTGMVYFLRAVLEFPVTQCIIYETEKESTIFSGLSLQEKLWWGGRSIYLVFYDGLFWRGMIGRKDARMDGRTGEHLANVCIWIQKS
jgi:hypothetical protein